MVRKRQRRRPMALQTSILGQVLLVMVLVAFGPLAPLGVSGRPTRSESEEYFQRESEDGILDRSGTSKQHSRRGISHPANNSPLNLQKTLLEFKDFQRTLSESVLFVDENGMSGDPESGAEDPEISYEIEPISRGILTTRGPSSRSASAAIDDERSPVAAAATRQHRVRHHGRNRPHHRLRHSKKDESDSGNLEGLEEESPSFFNIRVNGNLHKTSLGARPSSGRREATSRDWGSSLERSTNSIREDRQRDRSFSGILPVHHDRGCPNVVGGTKLMCPSTSKRSGYGACINVDQLCDKKPDCPGGEDESPVNCLFYKTTMGHFKKVVDAVISLADHMVIAEKNHHEL